MRNFLMLLIVAVFGIAGCNNTTTTTYPTGYNTPAAGSTASLNANKQFTVNGLTACASAATCNAVYYNSGSYGSGFAASDGTSVIKIFTTDGGANYTVVRYGAIRCNSSFTAAALISANTDNADGTRTVTFNAIGAPCSITAGNSIRGYIY